MRKLIEKDGKLKTEDGWGVRPVIVKEARKLDGGGYDILNYDDGHFGNGFIIGAEHVKSEVNPGDVIVLYTHGISSIRGYAVNGVEWHYLTVAEAEQERLDWLAKYDAEKEETYEKNKDSYVTRRDALIPQYRDRIKRFEDTQGFKGFWKDGGGYEMAVLETSQVLYFKALDVCQFNSEYSHPAQWVDAVDAMTYDEQVAILPEIDGAGLSGYQWSAVVGMTKRLLHGESV